MIIRLSLYLYIINFKNYGESFLDNKFLDTHELRKNKIFEIRIKKGFCISGF